MVDASIYFQQKFSFNLEYLILAIETVNLLYRTLNRKIEQVFQRQMTYKKWSGKNLEG